MNAHEITIETMKADHKAWLAAHAEWRRDIARWKKEHELAVARLAELQKIVSDHGEALDGHARTFLQAEAAAATHEREITEFLGGTSEHRQDDAANRHLEQEGVFNQQKSAHERINEHHEAVMKKLEALEAATTAAM